MRRRGKVERAYREGFAEGKATGRAELLPFEGIPQIDGVVRGAQFAFDRSWAQSFVAYERVVTDQLRAVQRARWLERRAGGVSAGDRLARVQEGIVRELRAVRAAVDGECELGHVRECVVRAMRARPNRPRGVREYRDPKTFLEEDSRRGVVRPSGELVLAGADYGWQWSLENPIRRWERTGWRVSWVHHVTETNEIYAVEQIEESRDLGERGEGRVWLLGTLAVGDDFESVGGELQSYAQVERNSLVALAETVRRAAHARDGASTAVD